MTDLPALAQAVRAALDQASGRPIGLGVSDPRAPDTPLWPEEQPATRRMIESRRREFAAGRAAARAAMAELGLPPAPVPMQPNRAPHWPDGMAGSISHTSAAAVAIVAPVTVVPALGIDIEEDIPLEAALWPDILTRPEHAWLHRQPAADRGRCAKQIFCIKEAVYKAQYPLTGRTFGFDAVTVIIEATRFRAELRVPGAAITVMTGQILSCAGLLASLCVPLQESEPQDAARAG